MDDAVCDPLKRIDDIIASHRVYMDKLGHFDQPRFFRGINFVYLEALRFVAARKWPPPVGLVAERVRMHRSHASHILTTLQRQGFVAVKRDPHDMRRRLYEATDSGRSLAEAFDHQVQDRAARIILYWPPWKQAEVADLLERLARALSKP